MTAVGGVTASCEVKVLGAPGSVQVQAEDPKLAYDPATGEGDSTALRVTLPSGSASAIAYTGYDPNVLEISAEGVARAVGVGSTRVTVGTFNGRTAWCVIRVLSTEEDCLVNVAHRGGAAYWPENTLEAFRNTESTGATAVELDARTTKDGVQVVHHDEYFTSGGKKRYINKLTLSELRRLKPGICTLDEALDVISGTGLELDLELKKTADPEDCVRIVRGHKMQARTVYISFEQSLLKKVRNVEPSARLGYIITSTPSGLDSVITNLGLCYILQKYDSLNRTNLLKWQNTDEGRNFIKQALSYFLWKWPYKRGYLKMDRPEIVANKGYETFAEHFVNEGIKQGIEKGTLQEREKADAENAARDSRREEYLRSQNVPESVISAMLAIK